MELIFIEDSKNISSFFSILPQDWQEEIVPVWNQYKNTTKVYLLLKEKETVGGGLVFTDVSPDMKSHIDIANYYFDLNLFYLGFIWINEKYRGLGYGIFWLNQLLQENTRQGYWLSIEDKSLQPFYEKVGFELKEQYLNGGEKEWIMTYQKD